MSPAPSPLFFAGEIQNSFARIYCSIISGDFTIFARPIWLLSQSWFYHEFMTEQRFIFRPNFHFRNFRDFRVKKILKSTNLIKNKALNKVNFTFMSINF